MSKPKKNALDIFLENDTQYYNVTQVRKQQLGGYNWPEKELKRRRDRLMKNDKKYNQGWFVSRTNKEVKERFGGRGTKGGKTLFASIEGLRKLFGDKFDVTEFVRNNSVSKTSKKRKPSPTQEIAENAKKSRTPNKQETLPLQQVAQLQGISYDQNHVEEVTDILHFLSQFHFELGSQSFDNLFGESVVQETQLTGGNFNFPETQLHDILPFPSEFHFELGSQSFDNLFGESVAQETQVTGGNFIDENSVFFTNSEEFFPNC